MGNGHEHEDEHEDEDEFDEDEGRMIRGKLSYAREDPRGTRDARRPDKRGSHFEGWLVGSI